MASAASGLGQACGQRRHLAAPFQRVLRRDQPPHFIEPQQAHGPQADAPMRGMGGIVRASKQAHAPGSAEPRQLAGDGTWRAQDRVCPLPWTTYL